MGFIDYLENVKHLFFYIIILTVKKPVKDVNPKSHVRCWESDLRQPFFPADNHTPLAQHSIYSLLDV